MSRIEANSKTWEAVEVHCAEAISAASIQLEQAGLDAGSTENLRGQIAALRQVLRLADPPAVAVDQDNYGVA